MANIVFFGDSLTAGYGLADPLKQSIPGIVSNRLKAAGFNYTVYNAGISGDTTASALKRLPALLAMSFELFVIELGANDFLRGIAEHVIKENLQQIIDQVKQSHPTSKILLLGIELPTWAVHIHRGDYNNIYRDLAAHNGISLVPSFLKGVTGNRSLNMLDGVHPLAAGYLLAVENIWPVLLTLI